MIKRLILVLTALGMSIVPSVDGMDEIGRKRPGFATGSTIVEQLKSYSPSVLYLSGASYPGYTQPANGATVYAQPNLAASSPVSTNLAEPSDLIGASPLWGNHLTTLVTRAAASYSGIADGASRLTVTGGGFASRTPLIPVDGLSHTASMWVKTANGAAHNVRLVGTGATSGTVVVPADGTWTQLVVTISSAHTGAQQIFLMDVSSAGFDVYASDFVVVPGVTPGTPAMAAGHSYSYGTLPTYNSAGYHVYGTTAKAVTQLPTPLTLSDITVFATARHATARVNYKSAAQLTGTGLNFTYLTLGNESGFFRAAWRQQVSGPQAMSTTIDANWHVYALQANSGTLRAWMDDMYGLAKTYTGSNSVREIFRHALTSNGIEALGDTASFMMVPRAMSDAEVQTTISLLRAHLVASGQTMGATPYVVAYEGDSLTDPVDSYARAITYGGLPMVSSLYGTGGSTIATMNTRALNLDGFVKYHTANTRTSVLSIWIGTNDLNNTASQALVDTFWSNLQSYVAARRAAGWKKIVLYTLTPRNGVAGYNSNRNAANVLIRASAGTVCDAVVDIAADPTLGPDSAAANTTYFYDGTHLTAAGQTIAKDVAQPVIHSMIGL
jgi:hypothetical protein